MITNKDKLKALQSLGTKQVLSDLLCIIEERLGMESPQNEDEEILRAIWLEDSIKALAGIYRQEIKLQEQRDKLGPQQRDLCELIDSITSGKEMKFVNKIINPDK